MTAQLLRNRMMFNIQVMHLHYRLMNHSSNLLMHANKDQYEAPSPNEECFFNIMQSSVQGTEYKIGSEKNAMTNHDSASSHHAWDRHLQHGHKEKKSGERKYQ